MIKTFLLGFTIGLLMLGTVGMAKAALIGHWDFEEGSGLTASDSSGNHLNGSIHNASYTSGRIGNYALNFNGSNSYVQVGYSTLLNPDSVGISLWFRPGTGQQTSADILDKGHGAGTDPYYGGYVLQYHYDSPTIDAAYGNGSTFPGLNSGGSYNDLTWHHMVANLGSDEISLYIDGMLISKISGIGPIVDNPSDLFFGRHGVLGRFYNGALDDIQIYDKALTADDVQLLYSSGSAVPEPATLLLFGLGLLGVAGVSRRKK